MSSDLPRRVLSEYFHEKLEGRRVTQAVFLTYRFDPGFFEQEILPVIFDIPLSHSPVVRRVQLEDALNHSRGQVAVYYDAGGLESGDESSHLDIQRIPVHWPRGIFHPKNVFLLAESSEEPCTESLLAASLSANLTKSGWWRNIEACFAVEIPADGSPELAREIASFLTRVRAATRHSQAQEPLKTILAYLQKVHPAGRQSAKRTLWFYGGGEPFADFLKERIITHRQDLKLEVISPYYDDAPENAPLEALQKRFAPAETALYLPRSESGLVSIGEVLYETLNRDSVRWSELNLPADAVKTSKDANAASRFAHAKVYHLLATVAPYQEWFFIGSVNLTRAAHQGNVNLESGFLVSTEPEHAPQPWLKGTAGKPLSFPTETTEPATGGSVPLLLRFSWEKHEAEAYWEGEAPMPRLSLAVRGEQLGTLDGFAACVWCGIQADISQALEKHLPHTSFVQVSEEGGEPVTILVQEEQMYCRPSYLLQLTVQEILKYWSLLNEEQRSAYVESHLGELGADAGGAALLAAYRKPDMDMETMFDRFAGFFHAFSCLERRIGEALRNERFNEADYLLFGQRYDSLPALLERLQKEGGQIDDVNRLVLLLSARQLIDTMEKSHPEYRKKRRGQFAKARTGLEMIAEVKARLQMANPKDAEFGRFLDWFEPLFLQRAGR